MPRVSEFFGIVIYMYWFDQQRHHAPHLHARVAGEEAVFTLDGNCIDGDLGRAVVRLAQPELAKRAHAPAELAAFGRTAVIVVHPSRTASHEHGG